jgi:nitrous oxidase accessory protein
MLTSTLLILILVGSLSVDLAVANFMPYNTPDHDIEITADGNVTGTDKIQHNQTVYTFTGNVSGSIVISCDNITIDGAGYALQRGNYSVGIFLLGRSGVVIKNMIITNFAYGVVYSYGVHTGFGGSVDNVLSGNIIANNSRGITCYLTGSINVTENKIMNNDFGIHGVMASVIFVYGNVFSDNVRGIQFDASGGKVYGNNFINNTFHIKLDPDKNVNGLSGSTVSWDNGTSGNYWSNYNGTDVDGDGIGDTPYIVDLNYLENYPLMTPIKFPTKESNPISEPEPFPTTLVVAASGASVAVIGIGLLIYFKKRKR